MTRTAAERLVLEFGAVCFVLCSWWLQSATKDKDSGNSGGAKTLVVGNFDVIFSCSFTFAPMKVGAFESVLSRYQTLPSHNVWLIATGSLRYLVASL